MDELERQLDAQASRLDDEIEMLEIQIDRILESPSYEGACLAVAQAKRAKRDVTMITRTLAKMRDYLQP